MISGLLAVIGLLGGGFLFTLFKGRAASALNTNVQTEQQVNKVDATVAEKEGNLQSEADKRAEIEASLAKQKATQDSLQDLTDFLNRK